MFKPDLQFLILGCPLFRIFVGTILVWLSFGTTALAYNTFGNGFGSKWDDPTFGTGAVVTWSFMTPGVGIANIQPLTATGWSGVNTLGSGDSATDIRVKMDSLYGVGAFDAAVERALATWSAAANIQFVKVADSGAPMGAFASGSTQPDVRIGAFHFSVGDLAGGAGFGPPGNDLNFPDPLAGDLALNDRNRFVITQGAEGSPIPTDNGTYLNDVEGLLLHEIGHTLGLGHSNLNAGVMCGYVYPGTVFDGSTCDRSHINHQLDPDDLAGVNVIYGARAATSAVVPIPNWSLVVMSAMLTGISTLSKPRRR